MTCNATEMTDTKHNIEETEEIRTLGYALHFLLSETPDTETEESLKALNARIDAMQRNARKERLRRWLYPAAAAVAVILVTIAVTFTFTYGDSVQRYANTGEVAVMVRLPDGTQVWINPGTELTFDRKFNAGERNVSLTGEAYFDVAHNPEVPFIVTTESFRVKVLGTVFNVKSMPEDARPEVSLAQGSIAMQNLKGVNLVRLRPGQQAVMDRAEQTLEISDIYIGDMLMRHYGAVSLHDSTVKEIVAEISQVYGVRIGVEGEDEGATYNFSFQKDSDIGDILDMLEFVCKDLKFSLE